MEKWRYCHGKMGDKQASGKNDHGSFSQPDMILILQQIKLDKGLIPLLFWTSLSFLEEQLLSLLAPLHHPQSALVCLGCFVSMAVSGSVYSSYYEIVLVLVRDTSTRRNILGTWTDPRATFKERPFMKDLIADIDVKTWGKGNHSIQHLKTKCGFIKSGNSINVSLTS